MADLIAKLAGAWVVLGLVMMILFGYFVPFSTWMIWRNVRKARIQLERLNDNIEGGRVSIKLSSPQTDNEFNRAPIRSGAGIGSLK